MNTYKEKNFISIYNGKNVSNNKITWRGIKQSCDHKVFLDDN